MSDWADEIANELHSVMHLDSDTGGFSRARFAAALRKAKADGMREAADYADKGIAIIKSKTSDPNDKGRLILEHFARDAREFASAIEKGTE